MDTCFECKKPMSGRCKQCRGPFCNNPRCDIRTDDDYFIDDLPASAPLDLCRKCDREAQIWDSKGQKNR